MTMAAAATDSILIVEDAPRICALIVNALSDLPYRILTAGTVRAATEHLEHANEIRMLVVDYSLPDGNGLDVVDKARALKPGVPILMMSGYAVGGADVAFLQKPFDPIELRELVESMVS